MRDEMDGRLWVAHHDELTLLIDRGVARVRHGLARLWSRDGMTPQLFAMLAAFLITSLGFTSTTA